MSKTIVLDIETRPATAYVWKGFKENISLDQIIEPTGILCVGVRVIESRESFLFSVWEHGEYEMLRQVNDLLTESTAVVTYNGDSFDLPFLFGEMIKHRLPPLPPLTSIDLYKTIRKTKFFSRKLGFAGPYLGLGKKLPTGGFELWPRVLSGDTKAQKKMERYCLQDVRLTERLYKVLKPYITDHPLAPSAGPSPTCGSCGSSKMQRRGYRRTRMYQIQRLQCQSCGSWQSGTRKKVV